MADEFFTNPLFLIIMVVGVIVLLIVYLFKRSKIPKFKEFKGIPASKTVKTELDKKLDLQGKELTGGGLYLGMHKIARIDKFFYATGNFSTAIIDNKTKDLKVLDISKDVKFAVLLLRAKNDSLIYRLLGIKKQNFILKSNDAQGNKLIRHDVINKRFFLPINTDLTSYLNVWMNTADGVEYVNDISSKRLVEEIMTHLENLPDKVVHIEFEQAKTERTARVYSALEKSKYDEVKKAGGTSVR